MSLLIIALCVAVVTSAPMLNEVNTANQKCVKEIKITQDQVENFLNQDKTPTGQAAVSKLQQDGFPSFKRLIEKAQNGVMKPNKSPSNPSSCSTEISDQLFNLARFYGMGIH